ncbi:hypothetical protein KFL_010300020 [Klebsormidium nitens]|uniref:Reverse transcriptase Ty1/copia-type domain-containing protein n=1 Tax=Klebsormidium nitens TaxID=105231 RepID=A0A1Y1IW47_KLENI|nr:hypothetical protein KFL_010300020 [Klebsormidium nitens]|eukprot:GAQ92498.1 hypothetical protein KFL_010300020 [Klebsormidium nitens]
MRLKEELRNLEFVASIADAALFTGIVDGERVYLVVRVDDILVAPHGAERIGKVKAHLAERFDVRKLGEATYFLGIQQTRDREARTLKLTQKKPTGELVGRDGLANARARSAMGALARYTVAGPTEAHRRAALGVVPYLAGTAEDGVAFKRSEETLVGYCDADYAGDVDTKRSTTGYVSQMYGAGRAGCSQQWRS